MTGARSSRTTDLVVVVAGVLGTWTALLARRAGRTTALVDAYGAGHPRATSGDETRIMRSSHAGDAFYARWSRQARDRWLDFAEERHHPAVRPGRRPVVRPARARLRGCLRRRRLGNTSASWSSASRPTRRPGPLASESRSRLASGRPSSPRPGCSSRAAASWPSPGRSPELGGRFARRCPCVRAVGRGAAWSMS